MSLAFMLTYACFLAILGVSVLLWYPLARRTFIQLHASARYDQAFAFSETSGTVAAVRFWVRERDDDDVDDECECTFSLMHNKTPIIREASFKDLPRGHQLRPSLNVEVGDLFSLRVADCAECALLHSVSILLELAA